MNAGKLNVGGILDIAQLLNSWTNIPAAVAAVVGTLEVLGYLFNTRTMSGAVQRLERLTGNPQEPRGSRGHNLGTIGHKPAQSKRITRFVIPQVNGGARR
ncbi:MAG TPA: hypothetical protein VGM32_09965 [Rhodopila sp.]